MLKGYYLTYIHPQHGKITLARVWAKSETEAKETALVDHAWCGVERTDELTLVRVNSESIWDQPLFT